MMKRKILYFVMAIAICITGIMNWNVEANAEEQCEDVDISTLMTEDALIGYLDNQTWGVYLANGYSIINKISSTKVGAGGTTNASVKCTVKITSILERKNSSGNWERITSWSQTNQSSFYAGISKSVTVASGYYYRVRSYHYAGSDSATSYTSALWVGN